MAARSVGIAPLQNVFIECDREPKTGEEYWELANAVYEAANNSYQAAQEGKEDLDDKFFLWRDEPVTLQIEPGMTDPQSIYLEKLFIVKELLKEAIARKFVPAMNFLVRLDHYISQLKYAKSQDRSWRTHSLANKTTTVRLMHQLQNQEEKFHPDKAYKLIKQAPLSRIVEGIEPPIEEKKLNEVGLIEAAHNHRSRKQAEIIRQSIVTKFCLEKDEKSLTTFEPELAELVQAQWIFINAQREGLSAQSLDNEVLRCEEKLKVKVSAYRLRCDVLKELQIDEKLEGDFIIQKSSEISEAVNARKKLHKAIEYKTENLIAYHQEIRAAYNKILDLVGAYRDGQKKSSSSALSRVVRL